MQVEALHAVRALTDRPVKVTLPGPMTLVDSLHDEVGRHSTAELAMVFADLLNREARALAEAGAAVVQFDEPCFNIYLDQARDWGVAALARASAVSAPRPACISATAMAALKSPTGRRPTATGATTGKAWRWWRRPTSTRSRSRPRRSSVDIGVIELLEGKDVLLGLVNVGDERVETAEEIAAGLRRALDHVEPHRLFACTDAAWSCAAGTPPGQDAGAGSRRCDRQCGAGHRAVVMNPGSGRRARTCRNARPR